MKNRGKGRYKLFANVVNDGAYVAYFTDFILDKAFVVGI